MKTFDDAFSQDLEKQIETIEQKTAVEVVVAISPESDAYIDTYYKGGLIFSFITLIFLLFSPVTVSEYMVPIDILVAFFIGAVLIHIFPLLKRILISNSRKTKYMHTAANAFFRENGLVETSGRTAFLLYISILERKTLCLGDKGVLQAIPQNEWLNIETHFEEIFKSKDLPPQAILNALPYVADPFSRYLPPSANNVDELSNRLRRIR